MPKAHELFAAVFDEFKRLRLDPSALPGGGLSLDAGGVSGLLERMRGLAPPTSWRDVFPDLPAHWIDGQPETRTPPYRPLGPYDYRSLPTGPAIHVSWPRETDRKCLDHLLAAAKESGWPIYGAGFIEILNPDWRTLDALIVLAADTGEDRLGAFLTWLDEQPEVTLTAVPRTGTETYLSDL